MASKLLTSLQTEEKELLRLSKVWQHEIDDNQNSISWAERSLTTYRANLEKAKIETTRANKTLEKIQKKISNILKDVEKDKQREKREALLERLRDEADDLEKAIS